MKNREKYTNTSDAEKAFLAYRKEHPIARILDLSFNEWLDFEVDEDKSEADPNNSGKHDEASLRVAKTLGMIGAGLLAGAFGAIPRGEQPATRTDEPTTPKDEEKLSFCPFCGSRKLRIEGPFAPMVCCDDCGAVYGNMKNPDRAGLVTSFNRRADKPTD